MLIFSTEKYEYLVQSLIDNKTLKNPRKGELQRKTFEDGEKHHIILSEIMNEDIMVLGGTLNNDDMMEVYDLSCALVKYGAKSLHLVIPFFGYSTQERATKPREIVKGKTRARMLSFIPKASNGNFIYLLEIHAPNFIHYFEDSVHSINLELNKEIVSQIKALKLENYVLASADMGNSKKIQTLAAELDVDTAFVIKKRLDSGVLSESSNNKIMGQNLVIYDDMIRSGKSIIEAVKIYKKEGAEKIYVMATHGVLCGDALKILFEEDLIEKVILSNSHPNAVAAQKLYPSKTIIFDFIPNLANSLFIK